MVVKKQIPNILTTIRIVCSILMICQKPFSVEFMSLYIVAGISDMLDGFAARKLHAVSTSGEKYDSISDFIFVIVCLVKLVPALSLQKWHLVIIGLIAVIKGINLLSAYLLHTKKFFLHTKANKITGFLLFVSPLALLYIDLNYVVVVVCIVALFAAAQEGHFIRSKKI